MKTLEIIKDELANQIGYDTLDSYLEELLNVGSIYTKERIVAFIDELSVRVQQEQQKFIAENAKMRGVDFDCDCGQTHTDWNIDKYSIINDRNIIQ